MSHKNFIKHESESGFTFSNTVCFCRWVCTSDESYMEWTLPLHPSPNPSVGYFSFLTDLGTQTGSPVLGLVSKLHQPPSQKKKSLCRS